MEIKRSLDPVYNKDAAVLILGSMPGEESLRRQQYYGYPRNHFWTLMADITGCEMPDCYIDRLTVLSRNRIALWDVIASCTRVGSLDTNIKDEKPNELLNLIAEMDNLKAVVFNGGKAAGSFKKHFGFGSIEDLSIEYRLMPSTSPANTAAYRKKLAAWSDIKAFLPPFS